MKSNSFNFIYVLDYNKSSVETIVVPADIDLTNEDTSILKEYGFNEKECSWMITDKPAKTFTWYYDNKDNDND